MNKPLKVKFENFWSQFNKKDNYIIDILKKFYDVKVLTDSSLEPDILFYSNFGIENLKWKNCLRIYLTEECDFPDFNICDYAIGLVSMNLEHRYLRFPLLLYDKKFFNEINNSLFFIEKEQLINRESFCYVVSNKSRNPIFFEFINKLKKYKKIDSGGKWNNNIGKSVKNKFQFINKYKFNICFENENIPGYVTEKILDAFLSYTIPIYWGSEVAKSDYPNKGYINISDFENLDCAIKYIKEIDNNDDLYLEILNKGKEMKIELLEDRITDLETFLIAAIKKGKQINNNWGTLSRLYDRQELLLRLKKNYLFRIYSWIKQKIFKIKECFFYFLNSKK